MLIILTLWVYVPTMWIVEGQSKCIAQQTLGRPIESLGFLHFLVSPENPQSRPKPHLEIQNRTRKKQKNTHLLGCPRKLVNG